jgi:hypothetical protein
LCKIQIFETFTILPCILYCPYPCHWNICTNVKCDAIKHSSILFKIKIISYLVYYWWYDFVKLSLKVWKNVNFKKQDLQINRWFIIFSFFNTSGNFWIYDFDALKKSITIITKMSMNVFNVFYIWLHFYQEFMFCYYLIICFQHNYI